MVHKVTQALIDALKQALTEPGEQRLFKSGKLGGLFTSRSGVNGEAAAQALREDLLEIVRTEAKGKTTISWVRATPRAVEFVHDQESPVQALRDLQAILQVSRDGVPLWLAEMQQNLQALAASLADESQRWTHRLEALSRQVEKALQRAEIAGPQVPDDAAADAPWAQDALTYLDRRQASGAGGDCPLPELFAALHEHYPDLSVAAFHERLRRLQDRRVLRLLPFAGALSQLPEPEFALLDGATLLYYAAK